MSMTILIIGGGEMGSSLAAALEEYADIRIWDTDQTRRRNADTLEVATKDVDVAIVCVPAWCVRVAMEPVTELLPSTALVVSLSKGLEETGLTPDRILAELLPQDQPIVVLGGPLLAEEVGGQRAGVGVVASSDENARLQIRTMLELTGLFLEEEDDADSVALAGVLKNVYAFFMGMISELGYGDNLRGYFLAACCNELEDIGYELGGDSDVLRGTAGYGDFLATALSDGSLNAAVGRAWAQRGSSEKRCEGVSSIEPLWELLGDGAEDFPILATLYEIVVSKAGSVAELVAELVP